MLSRKSRSEIRLMKTAMKPEPLRNRILLIASERDLPKEDVSRALKASPRRGDYLVDFAIAHNINLDWLILGDLRGLRRMKLGPS